MAKKRVGDPWMPAGEFGRSLSAFSVNLLVADVERAVAFYREVFQAEVRYSDPDFAALRIEALTPGPSPVRGRRVMTELMLHADHTYEGHPWHRRLTAGDGRGLGAELRLFGVDPDRLEERARAMGATVLKSATDKEHGWRETWVQDPDGYVWAVGVPIGG